MIVMAASDEAELVHMVATAASINDGPCAFRYPRGEGVGVDLPEIGIPLEIGKGRLVREGSRVALLSLGARLQECLKAADELTSRGLSITVADARFAKPLDETLISQLIRKHEVLITIEEGAIGGFGTQVLHFAARNNLFSEGCKIRTMFLPDRFVSHASPVEQYEDAAMTSKDIIAEIFAGLGSDARLIQSRA
jgi:1-deoxy-D-xylulose-5-phosphate synthase